MFHHCFPVVSSNRLLLRIKSQDISRHSWQRGAWLQPWEEVFHHQWDIHQQQIRHDQLYW